MATIEVQQLTKQFGDLTAVDTIDLNIAAGEVLCLLGPSGCGKTTTLRMIAGLERATSGNVVLAGQTVNDLSARERNVAMAFQFYALYPSLDVAANLAYPLHAEKCSAAQIRTRVTEIAKTLELESVLHRRPSQLSEGEKQRVAVGRAIIREPTCFLFDEPLSRLDVELRQTMRGQIKSVLAGLSKATVIVTHDQLEALTMADRIAVMRHGVIEQIDTPHRIFAEPSNVFVAGFIGTPQMNLLAVTCVDISPTDCRLDFAGHPLRFPIANPERFFKPGMQLTLGIRPRAFELANPDDDFTLTGTVDLIEPMGAETLIHLVYEGHDIRIVVRRGSLMVSEGDSITMRGNPSQTHFFANNGLRIPL